MKESTVQLPSGRVLEVLEGGDPKGRPVFALHGTPGSRLLFRPHVEDAERHGIRLIGYNRPGYGGSTPVPGRRVVDAAADVAAIADHLGLDRFAVWGHSGGGDPALACAAALPDRVVAAASLAGTAPYPTDGLDWSAGMGEFNVADFNLMLSDRAAWKEKSREDAAAFLRATPAEFMEVLRSLLSEVDRKEASDELVAFLQDQAREGYKEGVAGAVDDNLAGVVPWGFDLGAIRVPLQLWHGRHDRFVPFAHGEWLAARIPQADAHLEANEGHVSLFTRRIPEVHRWLAAHF